MRSVLFVCAGNICRSVMAEFLARRAIDDGTYFESAGVTPQLPKDGQDAVDVLSEVGIDASRHIPLSVWQLDLSSFDRIIAMDNFVAKRLTEKTVVSNLEVWRISDPYGDDFEQYRRTLRQVQRQILRLKRDML